MSKRRVSSNRQRSRPVSKKSKTSSIKRNKPAMFLAIFIIVMLVFSTFYVIFTSLSNDDNTDTTIGGSYEDDPEYIAALANTDYPVAVFNTTKGFIALELYNDKVPITCGNFIKLVNDGFYNGLIFHRVMDDFMIQSGKMYPDGTTKQSPYGNIQYEEHEDVTHVDGAISMASTGDRIGGSAEFFICDKAQHGLDGRYAAFGKTIYGIEVVRDIANEPHDGSFGQVGGGRPTEEDIIINSIIIVNQ